jgi:hypothetical protein
MGPSNKRTRAFEHNIFAKRGKYRVWHAICVPIQGNQIKFDFLVHTYMYMRSLGFKLLHGENTGPSVVRGRIPAQKITKEFGPFPSTGKNGEHPRLAANAAVSFLIKVFSLAKGFEMQSRDQAAPRRSCLSHAIRRAGFSR